MNSNLTHGSTFSGVGGFELGARMSGIETVWNCELEAHNRKILKKHFPETLQYTDIRDLSHPAYVDIISGGFPCQDISLSNTQVRSYEEKGINGQRSGLWSELFRVVGEVRPKYLVLENSSALVVRGFEKVLCDLSKIGYDAEWQCLQAAQFGYNHKRERLYCIAYPSKKRRSCSNGQNAFKKPDEILQQQTPRQCPLSTPIERFNRRTIPFNRTSWN